MQQEDFDLKETLVETRVKALQDAKQLVKLALKTTSDPRSLVAVLEALDKSIKLAKEL